MLCMRCGLKGKLLKCTCSACHNGSLQNVNTSSSLRAAAKTAMQNAVICTTVVGDFACALCCVTVLIHSTVDTACKVCKKSFWKLAKTCSASAHAWRDAWRNSTRRVSWLAETLKHYANYAASLKRVFASLCNILFYTCAKPPRFTPFT